MKVLWEVFILNKNQVYTMDDVKFRPIIWKELWTYSPSHFHFHLLPCYSPVIREGRASILPNKLIIYEIIEYQTLDIEFLVIWLALY